MCYIAKLKIGICFPLNRLHTTEGNITFSSRSLSLQINHLLAYTMIHANNTE